MPEPPMQTPAAASLNKAQVADFAERMAELLGFKAGDDIEAVVRNLGGTIGYQSIWDLNDEEPSSLIIDALDKFRIILTSHTSKERDRFTIAHELGHYFLHCLLPLNAEADFVPMRATRYGSDIAEWQANWFGASFLMPEAEFRRIYNETCGDTYAIAKYFAVSASTASVRAKSLNLAGL